MTALPRPEDQRPDSATMALLRESRVAIAARPVDLAAAVYRHLPSFAPRTKELLAADIRLHGERIVQELLRAAEVLDALAVLEEDLRRLGGEHAAHHGVPAEHFPLLGQALVRAVRELFPNSESGPLGSAWLEVFEWLADEMMKGAVAVAPGNGRILPGTSPAYRRFYVEDSRPPEPAEPPESAAGAGRAELPAQSGEGVDPAGDQTVAFDRGELFERLALVEEIEATRAAGRARQAGSPPAAGQPLVARPVSPAAGCVPPPKGRSPSGPGRTPEAPPATQGGRPWRARNPWSWASRAQHPEPQPEPWRPAPQIDPAMYDSPPVVAPPPGRQCPAPLNLDYRQVASAGGPAPRGPAAGGAQTELLRLGPVGLAEPNTAPAGPTAVGESAVNPQTEFELTEPTAPDPTAPDPTTSDPTTPDPSASAPGGVLRSVGTGWPRTSVTRPVRPAQDAEPNPPDLGDAPAQE